MEELEQSYLETREVANSDDAAFEAYLKTREAPPPREVRDDNLTVENSAEKGLGFFGTVFDTAKGVARGPIQAIDEMGETLESLVESIPVVGPVIDKATSAVDELVTGNPEGAQVDLGQPETAIGGLAQGISQFVTGFVPAVRAFRAAGVTGALATNVGAGAAADFSVFDPHEERLSDLLTEFDNPLLNNVVTQYLSADEDDGALEGRLKNVVEGGLSGAVLDGFVRSLRILRQARAARKAGKPGGAADAKLQELKDAQGNRPAELDPDGTPAKPEDGAVADAVDPEDNVEKLRADEMGVPMETRMEISESDADELVAMISRGETPDPAVMDFNFDNLTDDAQIQDLMEQTSVAFAGATKRATGGKVSNEVTEQVAKEVGISARKFRQTAASTSDLAAKVTNARMWLASSSENLKRAADAAVNGTPADAVAFRRAALVHGVIQSQVKGIQTNVARALQAMKIQPEVIDVSGILDQMGGTDGARLMARHVLDLADDPVALNKYVRQSGFKRSLNALRELHVNALLSNPATHLANIMGNTYKAVEGVAERAVAAGISNIPIVGSKAIGGAEVVDQVAALRQGIPEALRMAKKAWSTGEPILDAATKVENQSRAISAEELNLTGWLGRFTDFFGNHVVRQPGRALQGADEFFKVINYRMEVAALASRTVREEGIQDATERGARMAQLLQDPPPDVRMKDNIEIRKEAMEFARTQTFQENLPLQSRGNFDIAHFLGKGERLLNTTDVGTGVRFIIPFFRTPTNIVREVGRRTPGFNALSVQMRQDFAAGGARRDLALAKTAVGTGLYWMGYQWAAEGKVVGELSSDPAVRRSQLAAGMKPYATQDEETGEWIQFNRMDPMGMFLGLSADAYRFLDEAEDVDGSDFSVMAIQSLYNNLKNKLWLQGITDLVEAFESRGNSDGVPEALNNYKNRLIASFVPSVSRTLASTGVPGVEGDDLEDPFIRQAWTLAEELKARVPYFSQSVPPARDWLGAPVRRGEVWGPEGWSPVFKGVPTDDIVRAEAARLQMGFKKMPKVLDKQRLTHEQYDRYVALTGEVKGRGGRTLHEALEKLVKSPRYERATEGDPERDIDGGKQVLIKKVVNVYRGLAEDALGEEFPELQDSIINHKTLKKQALRRDITPEE